MKSRWKDIQRRFSGSLENFIMKTRKVLLYIFVVLFFLEATNAGVPKLVQNYQKKVSSIYNSPQELLKKPVLPKEDDIKQKSESSINFFLDWLRSFGNGLSSLETTFEKVFSNQESNSGTLFNFKTKDYKAALDEAKKKLIAQRGPPNAPSILSKSTVQEEKKEKRDSLSVNLSLREKRGFFNSTICSNLGILKFSDSLQDVCKGHTCTIAEVQCGNVIITEDELSNYPNIQISTSCNVTKLRCYDTASPLHDMLVQYNATGCVPWSFFCFDSPFGEQSPSQVSNSRLLDCSVQMFCKDSKVYGYQYFGFFCQNEELICNGSVVPFGQKVPPSLLPNCTIMNKPCTALDLTSNICYNYSIQCVGDIINGCVNEDLQVPCATSSTTASCYAKTLNCSGTSINTNAYFGPIGQCTVETMQCDTQIISMNSTCQISQLICSGQTFNGETFIGMIDNCLITQLHCFNSSLTNNCSLTNLVCPNTSSCSLTSTQGFCANPTTCQQYINTSSCICPIDRIGFDCSTSRPFQCVLNLIYPVPDCNFPYYQPVDPLLDSDPACLVFALDETATLRYVLECAFQVQPTLTPDVVNAQFIYWISNDKFSITLPVEWQIKSKIFNFNVLSDSGATTQVSLTTRQMLGQEAIWFNVTLNQVPTRFWHGNRLYMEVSWINSHKPPGIQQNNLDRRFLDSPQYQGIGTEPPASYTTIIVLSIVIPVLVGLVVVFFVMQWRKRKIKLELEKEFMKKKRKLRNQQKKKQSQQLKEEENSKNEEEETK